MGRFAEFVKNSVPNSGFYPSMKIPSAPRVLASCFVLSLLGFVVTGCENVPPYEESVLVDAGFHQVIPETVSERNAYAALPPYKVERTNAPGRPVYAYHDKTKDVTYIGDDAQYKKYEQLLQERGKERVDRLNAQINQDAMHMGRP